MPERLLVTGTLKLLESQKKLTVPIHVINLAEYYNCYELLFFYLYNANPK